MMGKRLSCGLLALALWSWAGTVAIAPPDRRFRRLHGVNFAANDACNRLHETSETHVPVDDRVAHVSYNGLARERWLSLTCSYRGTLTIGFGFVAAAHPSWRPPHANASSNALASCKSAVSNPSVNQP
jgi:hypothetical protein